MKKKILIAVLALIFPCSFAMANVDDDDWTYFFYLQYKQGVLGLEEGAAYPYDPIPVYFDGPRDEATAKQMDFYGIIVSGKGAKLAYFGFNKPETTVAALGKSVFTVKAPYYADADRADFYQKNGKKVLTISVRGSSFCNDDNKCNSSIGENYRNCPDDCPPPPGGIPPRETVPPPQPVAPNPVVSPSTSTPVPEVTGSEGPTILPGTTETGTSGAQAPEKGVSTRMKVFVVMGILALLLGGILLYMRRAMD